ncbi:MAG: type II toxin-antitoxin system VapB family antitoxin [Micrococcales bacterium]|nr:type II toxin-antitoxin system VapB family antitoxin [Micrococcales bacterium]MCL2667798.1 type II toxin-antitoxin system VapB family antitoxin [Micrococcales bacterium]
MSLNIKNERTHTLVRELAVLTGVSQTEAVTDAVERRLHQLRSAGHEVGRRARIDMVLAELRAGLTDADRQALRRAEADLYDETGLPR